MKLQPTKPQPRFNAISYPDESDRLRQSDSPCFFRIFKEQPKNKTQCEGSTLDAAFRKITKPGGANRDRTGDLLLAKQALSQLSYGPFGWELRFDPGRVSVGGSGWIRTIDPRLIKTVL